MKVILKASEEPMPIEFIFDEKKAVAAAGVLLVHSGGRMNYLRLIKLLYIADRRSLANRGRPIVGGRYVSMPLGPVLSEVLNLVKEGGLIWSQVIEKSRYDAVLKGRVDTGRLSGDEVKILLKAASDYKDDDRWTIVRKMHKLPEWKNPGRSSLDIPVEDILKALKFEKGKIAKIRQQSIERASFDKLFGS